MHLSDGDPCEIDNLNMQSSSGISWSTDECGHVMDDTSPSILLVLSQTLRYKFQGLHGIIYF